MPILDCNVKNCRHNSSDRCCLDEVRVETMSGDEHSTLCASFSPRGKGDCCEFAAMPDPISEVSCSVCNCTFNEKNSCTAGHIGISGKNACDCGGTECTEFCEC